MRISQRLTDFHDWFPERMSDKGAVFDSQLPNYRVLHTKDIEHFKWHDIREISVAKLASIDGAELMKYISACLTLICRVIASQSKWPC